jgi:hypothetical protein
MKRFILIAVLTSVAKMCCAQVKFGPVALGRSMPELPECPSIAMLFEHVASDYPCVDLAGGDDYGQDPFEFDASFRNLPAQGFLLEAYLMVDCHGDKTTCPVGKLVMQPYGHDECATALSALKRKFGPVPVSNIARSIFTNGYGARWVSTTYNWIFKNGDEVRFGTNLDFYGACRMTADTRAWRKSQAGPDVKFR